MIKEEAAVPGARVRLSQHGLDRHPGLGGKKRDRLGIIAHRPTPSDRAGPARVSVRWDGKKSIDTFMLRELDLVRDETTGDVSKKVAAP